MTHILHRQIGGTLPVAVGGSGIEIVDSTGKRYLDASGGAAVSCLGHGHPAVTRALHEQLDRLAYAHTGFFTTDVAERLGDRLHLIDRDNDGIVDVEEIRDALAAIALRQNKFREDPEALEAFIQVALREIDANSDDVITVEEVEKWFDSLEEEVEDQ